MYRLCKNLGIESFFAESRIDAAAAPEEPDPSAGGYSDHRQFAFYYAPTVV
jgi:hypothetical protein